MAGLLRWALERALDFLLPADMLELDGRGVFTGLARMWDEAYTRHEASALAGNWGTAYERFQAMRTHGITFWRITP